MTTTIICETIIDNITNLSSCIDNYFYNNSPCKHWLKTIHYDNFITVNPNNPKSVDNLKNILVKNSGNLLSVGNRVCVLLLKINLQNYVVYPFDRKTPLVNEFMMDLFNKQITSF